MSTQTFEPAVTAPLNVAELLTAATEPEQGDIPLEGVVDKLAMVARGPSSARFPRRARLLTTADYQQVFAQQHRSADQFFVCLAILGASVESRLGLAVSRKCARRAVARNRLKRLIRETFRQLRADLNVAGCHLDCVVLCRPPANAANSQVLRESLSRHLQRLRDRLCDELSA